MTEPVVFFIGSCWPFGVAFSIKTISVFFLFILFCIFHIIIIMVKEEEMGIDVIWKISITTK